MNVLEELDELWFRAKREPEYLGETTELLDRFQSLVTLPRRVAMDVLLGPDKPSVLYAIAGGWQALRGRR